MKEVTHIRKGHVIREVAEGGAVQTFDSINAAKRESRAIQKSGAVVRVEPHKQKFVAPKLVKPAAKAKAIAHNPRPTAVEQGQTIKVRAKALVTRKKKVQGE